MRKTAKGQTPYELAKEFIEALQQMKSGPYTTELVEDRCARESTENTDTMLLRAVERVCVMGTIDIRELPIMKQNKFKMSYTFLHWIATLSNGNSQMFICLLGLLATHFYKTHYKTEVMTLSWLHAEGCAKLFDFKAFFYWFLAAKSETNAELTIFEEMEPKEYYTFTV